MLEVSLVLKLVKVPTIEVQVNLEDLAAGADNLPNNGLVSSRNVPKVDTGEPF